jgi:hypothetical protein
MQLKECHQDSMILARVFCVDSHCSKERLAVSITS